MRRSGLLVIASSLLVSLSFSRAALASPSYPAVIQEQWQLKSTPDCTVCHATDSGGLGTVVTYFGLEMESLGVTAQNGAALIEALQNDKAQGIDSDGSGTSDYEDLVAGRDPNSGPGPKNGGPERPLHGCSFAPEMKVSEPTFETWTLVAALLVLGYCRRQRSSRSDKELRSMA